MNFFVHVFLTAKKMRQTLFVRISISQSFVWMLGLEPLKFTEKIDGHYYHKIKKKSACQPQ